MGLIRNAIEQGRQAMDSIKAHVAKNRGCALDVVIVGAGPAGFSASLAAMKRGLRYATLEQETLGGTVAHYPRGKIVMTAPAELPLVGKVKIRETTKEVLIDFWRSVEKKTHVKIHYGESVEAIETLAQGFEVKSKKATYQTNAVLLAIGRRGTPRKLGVPAASPYETSDDRRAVERGVGIYAVLPQRRIARALAKEQLGFYRAVENENPSLTKLELYTQTLMRHPGYYAERARALVGQTEEGVSWWPHDREPSFRGIVHYLAVSEYTKAEERSGTHVVFRKIIDGLIPAEL